MRRMFSLRNVTAAHTLTLLVILAPVAEVNLIAAQEESASPWEDAELQVLADVVGEALRGELIQYEDPFTLKSDFLKGEDGLAYVPFTVTLAPESLGESSLAMLVYVTTQSDGQAVAPEPPDGNADDERLGLGLPTAIFQDAFFIDVSAAKAEDGPIVLSRAFAAPGGRYDLYVAIRDSMGEVHASEGEAGGAEADPVDQAPPVLMVKSEVEVPDFWNGQLQTSSLILAEVMEPLEQPLTPEEQSASPYSLGQVRIVPRQDSNVTQADELSLVMLVYNATATANQTPDLTIEYDYYKASDAGEEYFNRTASQEINDETLYPGFDLGAGHQVVGGQSVPLTGFPEGAYRLQITVTDNAGETNLVRELNFNVSQ